MGAVAGLAIAAGVGMIPNSPAHAKPTVKDAEAKVNGLYHQAEQASERYNNAKIRLDKYEAALKDLNADKRRQGQQLYGVRQELEASVLNQYEGAGVSAVGQVVTSQDPEAFLDRLSSLSSYNRLQGNLMSDYSTQVQSLDIRATATERRIAAVAEIKKQLKNDKAEINDKLGQAKQLLSTMQASQRQALLSQDENRTDTTSTTNASAPAPTSNVPASGRAAAAVAYAMAQLHKAYVYGAAGPDAFDCSGLTMRAWEAAGVSLPHSSSAQYDSGPHIAAADLQPGDLVFYYSPISHVGMYIGNGEIINAENPSTGVVITGLYTMPYVGAVRPG